MQEFRKSFKLSQNYPDPFNPATPVGLEIPVRSFDTFRIDKIAWQEMAMPASDAHAAGCCPVEASPLYGGDGFVSAKKVLCLKKVSGMCQ